MTMGRKAVWRLCRAAFCLCGGGLLMPEYVLPGGRGMEYSHDVRLQGGVGLIFVLRSGFQTGSFRSAEERYDARFS